MASIDTERISLRIPARMKRLMEQHSSVSSFTRLAISEYTKELLSSGGSKYREVSLAVTNGGPSLEDKLDFLALTLGHQSASDHVGGGGRFNVELRSALRGHLTETQVRRLELHLGTDMTMEDIANREGCAKQAVFSSISLAKRKLAETNELNGAILRAARPHMQSGFADASREMMLFDGKFDPDALLRSILAREPVVSDFTDGGDRFHPRIAMALMSILTKQQMECFRLWLIHGMTCGEIAREMGYKSRTAAHKHVRAAKTKVAGSRYFYRAFCEVAASAMDMEIDIDAILREHRWE